MNVNFGLFPPATLATDGPRLKGKERGRAKKRAIAVRALEEVEGWLRRE
jgi:methylenetetrahydrofolate--tRNA-(uracil-5-)-methyltransferase